MKNQKSYIKKLKTILTQEEFDQFRRDKESLIDFGCAYMEFNDFKNAFKIFCIGIRLIGYDPDILNGLGVTLCELGRLRLAKSILKKTLELFPDDATTLANIAGVYWEECRYSMAIYYYNKSLGIDSDIIETHFNLINLYYEQGDLLMAYITSLNLLNTHPNNAQAKTMRNDIILDLGISMI